MSMPNSTDDTAEHAAAMLVVLLLVVLLGALAGQLFPRGARSAAVAEDTEVTPAQCTDSNR